MNQEVRLFGIEPEGVGDRGDATVLSNPDFYVRGEVPNVVFLEAVFDIWQGDSIIEVFPCYLVSRVLGDDMRHFGLTGAHFEDILVSEGDQFRLACPDVALPPFERLVPTGRAEALSISVVKNWSGDDICLLAWPQIVKVPGELSIGPRPWLGISQRALYVLQRHQMSMCSVYEMSVNM